MFCHITNKYILDVAVQLSMLRIDDFDILMERMWTSLLNLCVEQYRNFCSTNFRVSALSFRILLMEKVFYKQKVKTFLTNNELYFCVVMYIQILLQSVTFPTVYKT